MLNSIDYSLDHSVSGSLLLGGSDRLGRVTWLSKHIHNDDLYLLQDGAFSKLLLTEVLETFVSGQFIATIVLGFSLLERTIAGRLSHIGEKAAAKGSSEQLIDAAFQRKWLTQTEHDHINELRTLRNPIVHFREHLAKTRPEIRSILEAKTTTQMFESDAEKILAAVINILKKTAI